MVLFDGTGPALVDSNLYLGNRLEGDTYYSHRILKQYHLAEQPLEIIKALQAAVPLQSGVGRSIAVAYRSRAHNRADAAHGEELCCKPVNQIFTYSASTG